MKNLSVLKQETATMSSREIAKLCEKEHRNVLADIRHMCGQLNLNVLSFQHIYLDSMNRQQTEYLLNKDLTLTLVSGYNVKVRHAIIQRWQELENQQPKLDLPQDYLSALKALVASEEQKQLLAIENARLQEQSDTLAKISHAKDSQNVRDTAKALDINQNKFVAWCLTNDWLYRDDSGKLKAYQNRINQGFLTQKPVLGCQILSDSGTHADYSLVMRWTDKYNIKLAELGQIWQINDPEGAFKGVVTSVAVDVRLENDVPTVWQTVGIDRYMDG